MRNYHSSLPLSVLLKIAIEKKCLITLGSVRTERHAISRENIRVLVSPGRGNPRGITRDVRIIMTLLLSANQHDWIP